MQWHLAQVNIGKIRDTPSSALLTPFMEALDEVNARAEASAGFVWRLQDESGNATAIQGPWPEGILANLSVWESVEALEAFTFEGAHAAFLARRKEWFLPMGGRHLALWWIPAGTLPTLPEAAHRLDLLGQNGVTSDAFTLRRPFGPPDHPPRRKPDAP